MISDNDLINYVYFDVDNGRVMNTEEELCKVHWDKGYTVYTYGQPLFKDGKPDGFLLSASRTKYECEQTPMFLYVMYLKNKEL